jgi:small subunit ribosomal protein S15Ae
MCLTRYSPHSLFPCVPQDVEQWVQNILPARGFGHIILTTTFGIMDHDEARRKKTGGKVLGFVY